MWKERSTVRGIVLTIVIAASILAGQDAVGYEPLAPNLWHVRITNSADAHDRLCVRVYVNPVGTPGGGDTIYIGQGGEQKSIPTVDRWLEPGQSSDWTDVGVHMPAKRPETNELIGVFAGAMYAPYDVEAVGLVRIDTSAGTIEQISKTKYTDLGSAHDRAQKYFFGARPGGGIDVIDGSSGNWTFTSISDTAYNRIVGYRGGSGVAFGAKAAGGLDVMSLGEGKWITTNLANAGTRHYSDLSPEAPQPLMFAAPATADDYYQGGDRKNCGLETWNHTAGPAGLYEPDKLYTDLAFGKSYQMVYCAGPKGLDYFTWGGNPELLDLPAQINDTVYNSITGDDGYAVGAAAKVMAHTVFGAKASGGIDKCWKGEDNVWHTAALTKAGNTTYGILWKDWAEGENRNGHIFAAGKSGGLWRVDANDIEEPLLLSPGKFTSLVGCRELGSVIYGVASEGDQSAVQAPGNEATNRGFIVELARGPQKKVIRKVDVSYSDATPFGVGAALTVEPKLPTQGFLIPIDPFGPHRIWTLEEAAQAQLDSIGFEPGAPYEQCRYMWFASLQNMGRNHHDKANFKNPSPLEKMQIEIARRLGYNNLTQYARDAEDIRAMEAMGIKPVRGTLIGHSLKQAPLGSMQSFAPVLRTQARELREAGLLEFVRMVSLGDEYNVQCIVSTPEEQDAAFVAHLKQKGFKPEDFIRPEDEAAAAGKPENEQWKLVHLGSSAQFGGDKNLARKPKLLYEAYVFRYEFWARENAEFTRLVKQYFPEDTETGINFTPDATWPDVPRFINMVRDGGMTVPWSEDWYGLNANPVQDHGFMFAALRHAADYNNAPVSFYTIPLYPANEVLRMNYYALGNQVKFINHYTIFHQAYGHHGVYLDFMQGLANYPVIRRITSTVARIDERLYRARMRPAETAILMLKATDAWDREDVVDNRGQHPTYVNNWDRKSLFLALRHAHVPVDIVTDDDVAAGKLSKYKVLYLTGQYLLSESVPNLTQWVKDGGILVSSGGGGLLNQHGEPMPAMYNLYGLESANLRRPIRVIAGLGTYDFSLETMEPLDIMTFRAGPGREKKSIPVLCYKQTMKPSAHASVIATYSDGSPAAVERRVGRGQAVLSGGLLGLAYLRPAMNWIPESTSAQKYDHYPESYPSAVRKLISSWAKAARVHRPVLTSDRLVDATLQEGPLGAIVTLTNFRKRDKPELTVSIPGLPEARKITSLRHGNLKVTQGKNGPTVSLPLDQGDFLVVD